MLKYEGRGLTAAERKTILLYEQREYLRKKYRLFSTPPSNTKFAPALTNMFPCVNEGFESSPTGQCTASNSIFGWTISCEASTSANGVCGSPTAVVSGGPLNECWVVQTPVANVPYIGTLPNSPLGGSNVVKLQDNFSAGFLTKIRNTFPVTSSNNVFHYAFAGAWEGAHPCCDNAFSKIEFFDCAGSLIACNSLTVIPYSNFCSAMPPGFSLTNGITWTGWQQKSVNLSAFVGNCVTVVVTAGDCFAGAHFGSMFFDAICGSQLLPPGMSPTGGGGPVNFCAGSTLASIAAPNGYTSYSWSAPASAGTLSATQASQAVITLTNPLPGQVYTLTASSISNCATTFTYILTNSTVSIAGTGNSGSCAGGATGSASVFASGSGSGYVYSWTNASNAVVSTSSVAAGLPAGNYTVTVSAAGNPSCGTATLSTSIYTNAPVQNSFVKLFCGNPVTINDFSGSNFIWYSNGLAIPGATTSVYTLANAVNNGTIGVAYTTASGCRDSVKVILSAAIPGSLSVVSNSVSCNGSSNGVIVFSLSPSASSAGIFSLWQINNAGSGTPGYTLSSGLVPTLTFSAAGLTGGGSYSVSASDGLCTYTTTVSAAVPSQFDFTLASPGPSLCAQQCNTVQIVLSATNAAAYNFSWSPGTFLSSSAGTFVIICPTLSPGSQTNITYTVAVTPTIANCPLSKTLSLNFANPQTAAFQYPAFSCKSSASFTVVPSVSGGTFSGSAIDPNGKVTPSLAITGLNSFQYLLALGGCTSVSSGTYMVSEPSLSVSAGGSVCSGQSMTINASGASSYSWNGIAGGASYPLTPWSSAVFTITGADNLGCTKTATFFISVLPTPTLSVSGNSVICPGSVTSLTAGGASSFLWQGVTPGSTYTAVSATPSVITVTGNNPGPCSATHSFSVRQGIAPLLSVTGKTTWCIGENATLMASGANTYSWSTGVTTASATLALNSTTMLVVTGYSTDQCASSYSLKLTVSECLGINDQNTGMAIKILPNPFRDKLLVKTEENSFLTIYDGLGKKIREMSLIAGRTGEIDLELYADGIYLFCFQTEGGTRSVKVHKSAQSGN